MKLVITHFKLPSHEQYHIADKNRWEVIQSKNLDGLSTRQIEEYLKLYKEDEDSYKKVIVSADSRLLKFVDGDIFNIYEVYIRQLDGEILPIQDTTSKELIIAHNLMNMFDAGAFQ